MKRKNNFTKDELLTFYCLNFAVKYLRCIVVQAQIEKCALMHLKEETAFSSKEILKLNLKHSRLFKNLYDQKIKIECCA